MTRIAARSGWVSAALLAGCIGAIDGGNGRGGEPGDPNRAPSADDPSVLGTTVLRRLSVDELGRTASDLFGREVSAASLLPADPRVQGFERNADALATTAAHVDGFVGFAEQLAAQADLAAITGCTAIERACVETMLRTFGRRVLRRPLGDAERSALLASWDALGAAHDAETATRAVIARLLASPDFLYHVELGDAAGMLTPYELAARLSYLLVGSMPDDTLLDAAEQGRLVSDADLEREANRLLDAPRARDAFHRFVAQWLGVDALDRLQKDPALHPGFEALPASMRKELETFVDHVVFETGGSVADLFSATYTFADAKVAPLYGKSVTGEAFQRIDLDPAQRAGILTQSSVLAVHAKANRSAPILRGVFVLDRLLCTP